MSDQCSKMNVYLKPLSFWSLDPDLGNAPDTMEQLNTELLLLDLLRTPPSKGWRQLLSRYQKISKLDEKLPLVPAEDVVLKKIVFPLRSAKQAYVLSDYLACVALSGTIGEMVACLTFELRAERLEESRLTEAPQRQPCRNSFEDLGQSKRVSTLQEIGLWNTEQAKRATELCKIRNRYLHRLSAGDRRVQPDALRSYRLALELAAPTVSLSIGKGGAISPSPQLRQVPAREEAARKEA